MPQTSTPGPLTRAIGDILRGKARTERLTQEQLAAASGIDKTSVQRYLAGKRQIRVDDLAAMAKALGTSAAAVTIEAQQRLEAQQQQESSGLTDLG